LLPAVVAGGAELDEVLLTSGELLRGEIKRMRLDKLEFDSDKLGLLKLDWEDVAELHSASELAVRFRDGGQEFGKLSITEQEVRVAGRNVPRSALTDIIPVAGTHARAWSGKASAGIAVRSGNTDSADFTFLVETLRETISTQWRTTYNGAFGQLEGEQNVNNHRVHSAFDLYMSDRLYLSAPRVELYHDRFQNIDLRVSPMAGVGYRAVDNADTTWTLSGFGGYRHTRFRSVAEGESDTDDTGTFGLSSLLEHDFTDDLDMSARYDLAVAVPDTADRVHHLLTTLSFELTSFLDLDLGFTWDRIDKPRESADGSVPEKDDLRLSVGLGLDF
jgi:hypothetical protein